MMCYFQNVNDYRKISLQINIRKYQRDNQNGHARETGNIVYTRRRQTKQKTQHNMCWTTIYMYANKHK